MGEKAEGEAARRKEEEGGEGKAEGAEPALVLRFGIAAVAGKSRAVGRGKTEVGGSGERGSGGAEGGRRFWHARGCTGDGERGEEGGIGSWGGERLAEMGRRLGETGNTVETVC